MDRTAQDTYANMLRLTIGPKLRSIGFKGSAGTYVLPDDDRWLMVGFQKNRYSTAEVVSFTVNISAADKRVWAAAHAAETWVPAKPSGSAAYPWNDVYRLGPLAFGYDRWWEVSPGRDSDLVAVEVLDAIERVGLPFLVSSKPSSDIEHH